jgi:FkbM family methyltransferase
MDEWMDKCLRHLVEKDFSPEVVLDIGAAKGVWSLRAGRLFKEAEFFMIDPLVESEEKLRFLCESDLRFHYILTAVGREPGEQPMNITPDLDGSTLLRYYVGGDPARQRKIPVVTVDQLLSEKKVKPPHLVKIDVQGYELKVLEGGQKLFDTAEVFIIEANLFKFMPECPRVHEIIAFMAAREFFLFDLAGLLRRPFENDLAQLDLVFVSAKSPMVSSNIWMKYNPVSLVSVILCTYNPRMDLLDRALDSLEKQTISKSHFEVIVVDNNSTKPLDETDLKQGRSLTLRIIRELSQGLTYSRCAGISAAKGDLLIFMDDDNFLDSSYLENAIHIAKQDPRIGLYGGIATAVFETPISNWKKKNLPHLGIRDYGSKPITSFKDHWGEWEPIGAGMVARRDVGRKFVEVIENIPAAGDLGRKGSQLSSCEDALFARVANRLGYACSYQPALKLSHYMKQSRLSFMQLLRTVQGHGQSFVTLQRVLGKPTTEFTFLSKWWLLSKRFFLRILTFGIYAGFIEWFWDWGFVRESCRKDTTIESELK